MALVRSQQVPDAVVRQRGEVGVATVDPVTIPLLDLAGTNGDCRQELDLAWKAVLADGVFVGGPEVSRFESDFATYCDTVHCIGAGNGTDALELVLTGLGIGHGDEVILPANTFIATAEAVCAVGARPRFVDVKPDTLLLDSEAVEAAITPNSSAIIGVHLFGQMVDGDRLGKVAARHGLAFIEDAAQAHGARRDGRRAGSVGIAATFSFYPGKNLGALGDGGAVVTDDDGLASRIRSIANHGRAPEDRYRHDYHGRNSRLDSLQAALLSVKLLDLDAANTRRAAAMALYRSQLPTGIVPVAVHPGSEPVYHLAVVQVENRPQVIEALISAGIGWGVHYPIPCHLQPGYRAFHEHLPVAERAANRILSLPMSPTLTPDQISRVCDVLGGVGG